MSKLFAVVVGFVIGWTARFSHPVPATAPEAGQAVPTRSVVPVVSQTPAPTRPVTDGMRAAGFVAAHIAPVRVEIPSIDLASPVAAMGLTDERIVETPATIVGWYRDGAGLGQAGSVNLNGHSAGLDGGPGIFSRLSSVRSGDSVLLYDASGTRYAYRVISTERTGIDSFPVSRIYGPSERKLLNLVTCAGKFDTVRNNYAERTVVYAEQME